MNTLINKKVYVGNFSKEIQEKAFKLGFRWYNISQRIMKLNAPFIFFSEDKILRVSNDLEYFLHKSDDYEEVTSEWILSLPEPIKDITKEKGVRGFYIDNQGKVSKKNYLYNPDEMKHFRFFNTEEQAQAWAKLPELLYWRDKYNENWEPNWEDNQWKWTIVRYGKNLERNTTTDRFAKLYFKTAEIRDKFFKDFEKELKIVKPLL